MLLFVQKCGWKVLEYELKLLGTAKDPIQVAEAKLSVASKYRKAHTLAVEAPANVDEG